MSIPTSKSFATENEGGEEISISSLIYQKGEATKSKHDSIKDLLAFDDSMLDDVVSQTELMRKDTISTLSYSPAKTPTKKKKKKKSKKDSPDVIDVSNILAPKLSPPVASRTNDGDEVTVKKKKKKKLAVENNSTPVENDLNDLDAVSLVVSPENESENVPKPKLKKKKKDKSSRTKSVNTTENDDEPFKVVHDANIDIEIDATNSTNRHDDDQPNTTDIDPPLHTGLTHPDWYDPAMQSDDIDDNHELSNINDDVPEFLPFAPSDNGMSYLYRDGQRSEENSDDATSQPTALMPQEKVENEIACKTSSDDTSGIDDDGQVTPKNPSLWSKVGRILALPSRKKRSSSKINNENRQIFTGDSGDIGDENNLTEYAAAIEPPQTSEHDEPWESDQILIKNRDETKWNFIDENDDTNENQALYNESNDNDSDEYEQRSVSSNKSPTLDNKGFLSPVREENTSEPSYQNQYNDNDDDNYDNDIDMEHSVGQPYSPPLWIMDDDAHRDEFEDVENGENTTITKSYGENEDYTNDKISSRMQQSVDRRRQKQQRKAMYMAIILCCCILTIIALTVTLVVLLRRPSSEESPYDIVCQPFPSQKRDNCVTAVTAFSIIHPQSTWNNLLNPNTCQFQTLDFLLGTTRDDNIKFWKSDERIRQRYAMAVMHCEFHGPSWFTKDFHLIGDDSECTWSDEDLVDKIDGSIDPACDAFGYTSIIRINSDQLLGTLAPEISMLTNLQELSLAKNNIFGTVPSEYEKLVPGLNTLILSSNQLNGTIPSFLYGISNIDMSDNMFSGSIPSPSNVTVNNEQSKNIRGLVAENNIVSLILHDNALTGVIPSDIIHPGMKELLLHNNQLTGDFDPPTLDEAKSLIRLTLYNNKISGDVDTLCSLSVKNGGVLESFAVDLQTVQCHCCTNTSEPDNIFKPPTVVVPDIPPPSESPTTIKSISPSEIVSISPTLAPQVNSMEPTTFAMPMLPTTGTISIPVTPPSVVTNFPTAYAGTVLIPVQPTVAPETSNTSIGAPSLPPIVPTQTTNITVNRPFLNVTTARMDPYVPQDCYFEDNVQPNILNQCECYNSVQTITDDILSLYTQVRDIINLYVYRGSYNTTIDSCQPQNKALIWLSSGNTRDSGDLYQRYILALLFIQMNGYSWNNYTNWLSDKSECDWFGVQCESQQVLSISLKRNNLKGQVPSEISFLSAINTIALDNNQLTGTIPSALFDLRLVTSLTLTNNTLIGTIPSSVALSSNLTNGKVSQLQVLKLDKNFLVGTIPSTIGSIGALTYLSLNSNSLSGSIPTEISLLTNLRLLHLYDCRLSGTIPSEMGILFKLEDLRIDGNILSGIIPQEICLLRSTAKLQALVADKCNNSSSVSLSSPLCPTSTCCSSCRP